jgi:hypothetical protein
MGLAWQCGEPHADLLLERLSPGQITEIQAFAATEPLPERRADLRTAMECLATARSAGAKGATLDTFLLQFGPAAAPPDQDQDEMNRQMMKVAALFDAARAASREPPTDGHRDQ